MLILHSTPNLSPTTAVINHTAFSIHFIGQCFVPAAAFFDLKSCVDLSAVSFSKQMIRRTRRQLNTPLFGIWIFLKICSLAPKKRQSIRKQKLIICSQDYLLLFFVSAEKGEARARSLSGDENSLQIAFAATCRGNWIFPIFLQLGTHATYRCPCRTVPARSRRSRRFFPQLSMNFWQIVPFMRCSRSNFFRMIEYILYIKFWIAKLAKSAKRTRWCCTNDFF